MASYQAPLRDMNFVINEVWDIKELIKMLPYYEHVDSEFIEPILEQAAKFCENELAPLNQSGDKEGVHFNNGEVTTPKGFKEAYRHLVEGGWMSLNADPQYGGQGLPKMLQILLDEMLTSSNVSFSLYTALTQGAIQAVQLYASDEIKKTYLPKLVSGEWSGTMCLTESHCGTDLGLLRTKAEPQSDGNYKISGTKIFITSGEHDLTENIIHTVLARLPNAPAGVKGISLFLVPKFLVNKEGTLDDNKGGRNPVYCGSIEHKMGIKASSTCVMNFDNATGYLIGEPHKGMQAMFSVMNLERINIGIEGLGLAEVAYQNALAYAKDRLQSRSLSGAKYPDKIADPIIVHPDVRRMLLIIKAYNEGARAFVAWIGMQVDIAKHHSDPETKTAANNLILLTTPVIKAFFTDYGCEACNLGLQVLGGHGYINEWGMEQFVRDVRIAQIYEGTNGIQALDLVRRKLVMNKGQYLNQLTELMSEFIAQHRENEMLNEFINPFEEKLKVLVEVSYWIMKEAEHNPEIMGASSNDYLRLFALVILAFMWAKMAVIAVEKQDQDKFYKAKLHTARFYFKWLLPNVDSLKQTILAGSDVLMDMDVDGF